jgi:hypothetical protein
MVHAGCRDKAIRTIVMQPSALNSTETHVNVGGSYRFDDLYQQVEQQLMLMHGQLEFRWI